MQIREARADEIDVVRTLFSEYAASLPFRLDFQHFDEELRNLPGEYSAPEGAILLALAEGAPAGCVALRRIDESVCEMKRLWVRPAARGLALGRALTVAVMEAASTRGYRSMRLDTVPSMERAVALYRSLGFHEIAPYRFNPVEGTLYFEIELG